MIRLTGSEGTTGALRASLLSLATLGLVGIAISLAYERHWDGFWQILPWVSLGVIALALAALVVRPSRWTVRIVRTVAVLTIVVSALGFWQHFDENYQTASLDYRYSERWETMSVLSRWWEVAVGSVGHVPIPASVALAPVGIALALATIGLGGTHRKGGDLSIRSGRHEF